MLKVHLTTISAKKNVSSVKGSKPEWSILFSLLSSVKKGDKNKQVNQRQ